MRKFFLTLSAILCLLISALAQNRTITGKVTDATGQAIIGASVLVKGTRIGTTTNLDGSYSINVPSTARTLVISFTDMSPQEIIIRNQLLINTILQSSDRSLNEVVVTGYSTKRKSEFTGASTKVMSKEIEQVPIASFEQILQGRAPGLYIASGSGQPGTSARVNIRGVGSISGSNDPLYILDGIPIEAGIFRSLNPDDFENVEILKDAAGAGLYGSRGANGVIVITSKKGKAGKTQIQFRTQAGFSDPPSRSNLRLMNTDERLQYEENVLGGPAGILSSTAINGYPGWDYSLKNPRYQTLTPAQRTTEAALLDSIRNINTNWPSIFFQRGSFKQNEISASGGSEGLSFYTSLSAYNQQGVIIRSNLDRYTFRANLDFKTKNLTVSVRSSAGWSSQSTIESEAGVALANPVAAAYLELPYVSLNKGSGGVDTASGRTGPNAFDRIFTTTALANQFKGDLSVSAQYDIWGGISFKTTNGVDWRNNTSSRFIKPNSYAGGLQPGLIAGGRGLGSYGEGNLENLQLISTTGFVFNRTFNTKHKVTAQAMIEAIRNRTRSNSFTGYGINAALPNTPAGITSGSATGFIPAVSGNRTVNGLYSEFLIADYTFDRRFTVSGSLRNDAPSQVPEKNRTNIFYTFGGTWNFIREKFMANQKIFTDAQIHASYGQSGNVAGFTSNFGYISTYGQSSAGYAGVPGIIPTSPGNTDYRLESQVQTDLGVIFNFLSNRIRTSADYYVKKSKNLFITQNLSRTTGFLSLSTNAGEMRNRGFEFDVKGDVISNANIIITLGINGAFNKNVITSLGPLTDIPAGTGIYRVGYSFGTHFTVGYKGVDPQSGLPVYEDINGNPTTIYNASNNRAAYGTYLPSFTGGASLDISVKGFFISTLLSTAQGVMRFNNEDFFYESTNSNVAYSKNVELLNTWQKPGDITNYQRISATRQFSSKDIQDASFIRLRNVQAGYTYTFKSKFIRSFRLWGQGENLYTWTKWRGFDPEESNNIASYEFPNPKTYTIGLDINF